MKPLKVPSAAVYWYRSWVGSNPHLTTSALHYHIWARHAWFHFNAYLEWVGREVKTNLLHLLDNIHIHQSKTCAFFQFCYHSTAEHILVKPIKVPSAAVKVLIWLHQHSTTWLTSGQGMLGYTSMYLKWAGREVKTNLLQVLEFFHIHQS